MFRVSIVAEMIAKAWCKSYGIKYNFFRWKIKSPFAGNVGFLPL